MVKSVFVVINCSHNISNLTRIAHKIVLKYLKTCELPGASPTPTPGPLPGLCPGTTGGLKTPGRFDPPTFQQIYH